MAEERFGNTATRCFTSGFRALLLFFAFCWAMPAQAMTGVPYGGVLAAHSAKCLSVLNGRVVQASCRNIENHQWQVQPSGAYFQLSTRAGCLSTGGSLTAGSQVVHAPCSTTDGQLWSLVAQNGGYALKSKVTKLCLAIAGSSQQDGGAAVQWTCTAALADQTFHFDRGLFGLQAPVSIVSQNSGLCANVDSASRDRGKAVIQWPCTGAMNDTWTLKPVGQAVNIVNRQSGLCLAVAQADKSQGGAVIQWPCSSGTEQQWRLQAFNGAWRLVAVHSGQCLNVPQKSVTQGTRLVQWPCKEGANELWSLRQPSPRAQWSDVTGTSIVAAAAANMPNGNVLTWAAQNGDYFVGADTQTVTEVLDVGNRTYSTNVVMIGQHDMFCPGTAMLADGRLLVNGGNIGNSSTRTSLYNFDTGTWSAGEPMLQGRGYQGTVLTANGTVFTLGGSWSGSNAGQRNGELWTAGRGWTSLPGVPSSPYVLTADAGDAKTGKVYRSDNHLWLQVLSGGRLLHAGPSREMHWIDTSGQGNIWTAGKRGEDGDSMNGNIVYYDVDQLLKVGGAPSYDESKATAIAMTIDASGTAPAVERVAPMLYPRGFSNSVALPNGQVIVVGGQTFTRVFSDNNAVRVAELWDPATKVFTQLPAMATPRTYHSVALLLPDARVWVAGGGLCPLDDACRSATHTNYEVLTPPYLLNPDGTAAARPVIESPTPAAPLLARLGETVTVKTSTPVAGFSLVRLSAATHSVNNDQRRVPVRSTTVDGKSYSLTLPVDPGVLVPGYYMLFALNAKGVPSKASTLLVAAP